MRQPIFDSKFRFLHYSIREIVDLAQQIKEIDSNFKFIGENIGDPIVKSWPTPQFLKDLINEEVNKEGDKVFGYTHSRGHIPTRKWVAKHIKKFVPSSKIEYEDILFTSGLGAAISALYHMVETKARIIQPAPSYPTHTSLEAMSSLQKPITYRLNPHNNWQPDLEDLEQKIKDNPEVSAILVINPNNPTGAVYSRETLEKIVEIAEKYDLMIISDEVYFQMVYNNLEHVQIAEIAADRAPVIVMRGLSKDVPWPGGRCGWLEFHGTHLSEDYRMYCESLKKRVMMEVCSVSLPQYILPKIYDHPDFPAWNERYNAQLQTNSNEIASTLKQSPHLLVNPTNGAFYMMPLFKEGVLSDKQTLEIQNPELKTFIEEQVSQPDFPLDKRFCYYLLATTGICVVPASGFYSEHYGFRLTTLERDPQKRKDIYDTVLKCVNEYIASA